MLTLGSLTFTFPAALLGLALLPTLWWLLRVTPPAPKRIVFPPIRLLLALVGREQQSVRTPLWLLLLRLLLAFLLVLAASRPVYDAGRQLAGSGPLLLVVDNGWAAATAWRARQDTLVAMIDAAERDGRGVVLLPTAAAADDDEPLLILPPAKAREAAAALRPQPWATDRNAALRRVGALGGPHMAVVWLADGLGEPGGSAADRALFDRLIALGGVRLILPKPVETAPLLRSDPHEGRTLTVTAMRAATTGELSSPLRLIADDGSTLGRETLTFAANSARARASLDLPAEWQQRLSRLEIEGLRSAGSVVLVDRRWQRRAVGIAVEPGASGDEPLLDQTFYIERALEPYAELRSGAIGELLNRKLSVLVLPDVGRLDAETAARVEAWVQRGGVLLRFAGPRLAAAAGTEPDPLLPVRLRPGDRSLGGPLSWNKGGQLAPFEVTSPFNGLVPGGDITVERQVLAEPTLNEAPHTWARLIDGTPLISGAKLGDGWLVLVHTSANTDWSNLALSGLFVDVLRRIVDLSERGDGRPDASPLAAVETLDGFGRLGPPPKSARPIGAGRLETTVAGPSHPPGYYGRPEARVALNLAPSLPDPRLLAPPPRTVTVAAYDAETGFDPLPWLLAAALLLALLDLAVSLKLRGILTWPSGWRQTPPWGAAILLSLGFLLPVTARAQTVVADGSAPPAALTTRLAYVLTGDAETDRLSAAGLTGLAIVVNRRTAAELAEPVGVHPDRDDLSLYPLLYWPLVEPVQPPSPAAARRLAAYMRAGGTLVLDTRGGRGLADRADLLAFARALDLPRLVPVGPDHVLHRSYYLLADLPGRFTGSTVWVEASGEHVNDGVSAVIVGANDWAGAWAVDAELRPLRAVVPGGERQRELAFRFGVNLVMYVLTGNYKTDQVHLPTILDRLRSEPR
jgi:hypothetical protein